MKLSEDPEKSTLPGRKSVYRVLDTDGQYLSVVYMQRERERENIAKGLRMSIFQDDIDKISRQYSQKMVCVCVYDWSLIYLKEICQNYY